jgi:GT2 family glycosyltransferase
MNRELTLIGSDPDVKPGLITGTYGLEVDPPAVDRMAILSISKGVEAVEEALVLFVDTAGTPLGQHGLLVVRGQIEPSVLHVPAGTSRLLVALTVPEPERRERIPARLEYPGRLAGITKLALYVYRINRQRGVSLPRLVLEKSQQLYRLGIRNLLRSPSSHVQLRELTSSDYLNWIRRCTETLLETGSAAHGDKVTRLAVFVETGPGTDSLERSLDALQRLRHATVRVYLVSGESSIPDELAGSWPRLECSLVLPAELSSAVRSVVSESDWCSFIRAGDLIRPHALQVLNRYVTVHGEACICYSDHDHGTNEARHSPWFKPRWSPQYYLNTDYVGRAIFFRADWLSKQPMPQSMKCIHETLLLVAGQSDPGGIHRIADVLFTFPEPPACRSGSDRQDVVTEHLNSQGISHAWKSGAKGVSESYVDYSPGFAGCYPGVSIIVPTRDQVRLLKSCVESLLDVTEYPSYEILIVDNGSRQSRTKSYLRECASRPECTVLDYDAPFNFSAINNFAVNHAKGELVCLVNNDIQVFREDWLSSMAAYFALRDVGAVGAKLLYRDRRVQHAGVVCGLGNVAGHAHRFEKSDAAGYMNRLQVPGEFSGVTAACLLTRRSIFQSLGGFNARELAVAYNDVDYCLKLWQAGYSVIFAPQAEAFHLESKSRGSEDTEEKRLRYRSETQYMWREWGAVLEDDPFYNPNLSRVREDYSIAPIMMSSVELEKVREGVVGPEAQRID